MTAAGFTVWGIAEISSLRPANANCWNPDILSDASFNALENIIKMIKGYVNNPAPTLGYFAGIVETREGPD
ncbi:hypothetical protein BC826DRAFT_1113010 [Russula brevipes]|nr:hypothetical protein BC826DRAFT_1113010 [Russula brevipes]